MSNVCEVCQKEATQACSACRQVFYCCKDHQKGDWKKHKPTCACYKIVTDQNIGRCVVATRFIHPGEVIMKTSPLILGPKTVSVPICLGCHKKLTLSENRYDCKTCRWPLCDVNCEKSPLHEAECEVLAKSNYKPTVANNSSKQSVYSSITPLRALLLKKKSPAKFALLLNCQSHLDEHLPTDVYQILRRNLVPFYTNLLKIDADENEVLTICSIFDTNCFDVRDRLGSINARGLYPNVVFLSHNCRHNTKHSFDDKLNIIVRATLPIEKGELITVTYTQTLWGTLERRAHLKMGKQFDCFCDRCKDSTEFGTYLSATKCLCCKEGKIVSSDPVTNQASWICDHCGILVNAEDIFLQNKMFKREILQLDKSHPKNLEHFLDKHKEVLHSQNSYCLQVKYALTQMYGNIEGFTLKEMPEELLIRKTTFCEELLKIAVVLEPGQSRFRGLLLHDLYTILMEKVRRGEKVLEKKALEYLEEAITILKTEPDFEDIVNKTGELHKIIKQNNMGKC